MQWSKIKTLFILSFLVLNVYLLIQYIDKQERADLDVLNHQEASVEEQLEAENITIEDINVDVSEDTYISVSQHIFTDEDKEQLAGLSDQTPVVFDDRFIVSQVEDPIAIPETATPENINNIVRNQIIFPESYSFREWNEETNVLLFFQDTRDMPIYFNAYALLMVYLNEDNEMVFYTQSMLSEPEPQGDLKTLTQPIQALGTLYDQNHLYPDDVVNPVEIGYHTRIPLANGEQVFAPSYHISVNEERSYFVNAIEGQTFPSEEAEFIQERMDFTSRAIEQLDDDHEWKEDMLNHLDSIRENDNNRSDME
jgi:regulatory protein YycI of two-component signal transduction system YycFG